MQADKGQSAKILAVVVIYQMQPEESLTLQTLEAAVKELPEGSDRFKTVIYDNTPGRQGSSTLANGSMYIAPGINAGISEAYNRALALARAEGFDWLLTLDQDTELPPRFLLEMAEIAGRMNRESQVASILPLIMQDQRVLSPHWFEHDLFPRAFSSESIGVQNESAYAFNSGALLRVSSLQQVGGYNPLFWLDYSDAYIFRMLHLAGFKGYVAGQVAVQHHLSILDVGQMSNERYRNIVNAGSAFCDLFRNWLVGLEFTYKLIRSYGGLVIKRHGSMKKQILATAIRRRLLLSRSKRIKEWTQQETNRQTLLSGSQTSG